MFQEFEASEMSISFYMTIRSRGDDRFVGVSIFPPRHFRHGFIFIRSDAGIERPEDLAGKRIGMNEYPMTATLWIRALLHHDYGVKATDVQWFQGGVDTPGFVSRFPIALPPEIRISTIPEDKSLVGMLLEGEMDAVIGPGRPQAFVAGDPRIRRLFPNYREAEKDYYRRTGFYPMDHMVVVRRDIYERYHWMPNTLLEAFEKAKEIGWARLMNDSVLTSPCPGFLLNSMSCGSSSTGTTPSNMDWRRTTPCWRR